MGKQLSKLLVLLLTLTMLLCACGESNTQQTPTGTDSQPLPDSSFIVTVCIGGEQNTLDPAKATAAGSEIILFHLFENLMRWEDDGDGFARLAPGQAESYALETDFAGNATYTFTLREGISWSDGTAVTANDFVNSWQRLADPATGSPHQGLMSVIAGYDQVQETGDPTLLAVSAADERTFVVTLTGSCAYFLEEVCASAYTMPVRTDLAAKTRWGSDIVTNGTYTASLFAKNLATLERSETYYNTKSVGPDVLQFVSATEKEADYGKLLSGEIDLMLDLPAFAVHELQAGEQPISTLTEPVTTTYGVVINVLQPPFDDINVRQAFQLAVDTQAVIDQLGSPTWRAAPGLVPYGIADYGVQPEGEEEPAEEVLPDPNAEPIAEEPAVYWDFRIHSQELVTLPEVEDYASRCRQAQALMAQAGYAGGGGFPVVEYIYVDSDANRAIARSLQTMWQEQLGVTVTVRGVSQEEYNALMIPVQPQQDEESGEEVIAIAPYQLAGMTFTAAYNDANAFLSRWHSASTENCSGYSSSAFDILLDSAKASVSFEARDAYLHDAEAILLSDAPVIPVCCQCTSYQLSENLEGLYRSPNGVLFFSGINLVS